MKYNLERQNGKKSYRTSELIPQFHLYIIIQVLLYISFLTMDFTNSNSNLSSRIKFTMIVLCFCYVLFYQKSTNKSILFCLRAALFFTVISDLFILLLDYYFYGVLSFIIVQQLYGIKIDIAKEQKNRRENRTAFLRSFLIRISLQVIFTVILCLILDGQGVVLERLLIVTVFYFISIVTNVIRAVRVALLNPKEGSSLLFAIGMVLFLLCDISVGLFNLSDFVPLSNDRYGLLYSITSILMWAFYAPSQVLIALSVKSSKINKKT